MSILLAASLAASAASLPSCSWDRPGVDPFMGDVVAAVDRYSDIPAPVRAALKQRMAARQYDEIATIRRDSIAGKQRYRPEIRDMHFGQGQVCRSVTRSRWSDSTVERGLVYCEDEHCIIVPTVCRNVSRITRERAPQAAAAEAGAPAAAVPVEQAAAAPAEALLFDPPGAGPLTGTAGASPSFARLAGGGGLSVLAGARNAEGAFGPSMLASRSMLVVPLLAPTSPLSPMTPREGVAGSLTPAVVAPVGEVVNTGLAPVPPAMVSAGLPAALPPGPPPTLPTAAFPQAPADALSQALPQALPQAQSLPEPLAQVPPMPGDPLGPLLPTVAAVTAVPEPGSLALWLAGLGVLGLLARQRRGVRDSDDSGDRVRDRNAGPSGR